jgi:hypothetical protein
MSLSAVLLWANLPYSPVVHEHLTRAFGAIAQAAIEFTYLIVPFADTYTFSGSFEEDL